MTTKSRLAALALIGAMLVPIVIPSDVAQGPGDIEEEQLEGYVIRDVLRPTGRFGMTPTRKGFVLWMEFTDLRGHPPFLFRVKLNEAVLLVFADGSRRVLKMIGPDAPGGLMFQVDHEHVLNRDGTRARRPERGAGGEHPGKERGDHYAYTGTYHPPTAAPYDPYNPANWSGPERPW